jgi:hypothetical protein
VLERLVCERLLAALSLRLLNQHCHIPMLVPLGVRARGTGNLGLQNGHEQPENALKKVHALWLLSQLINSLPTKTPAASRIRHATRRPGIYCTTILPTMPAPWWGSQ